MLNLEFIRWEETPEQKFLGIAHLLYDGCFVLKFKIVENKDASGFFVASPSYKREFDGQEKWSQWFYMDSRSKGEYLQDFVRNNVINAIKRAKSEVSAPVVAGAGGFQAVQQQEAQTQPAANNQQPPAWAQQDCPF